MSWLFSRALVAAFSAENSLGGGPSAPLSLMPTPHPFLHNGKTTAFSKPSQYGQTYEVLTADRGEALLTWYRAAFRVPIFRPQARAQESPASNRGSGWKWPASYAKYDHDSRSWKTRQSLLLGDSEPFSETWPRWGWMRDGESSPLRPWVPRMSASVSGSWPTPRSEDSESTGAHHGNPDTLHSATQMWATPCTPNGGNGTREDGRKVQVSLESQAKSWQTPRANDAEKRGDFNATDIRNGLAGETKAWATPTTRDFRSEQCSAEYQDARDAETRGKTLGWEAKSFAGTTEQRGSLSPEFHLWLMGWPAEWNALEPLATAKYRSWLQQHGEYCEAKA